MPTHRRLPASAGVAAVAGGWNVSYQMLAPLLAFALALAGCKDNPGGPSEPVVASVELRLQGAPVTEITLEALEQTVQLEARAQSSTGAVIPEKSFTWTSSNEGVATVSATGEVRAVGPGSTTITARTDGASGSVTVQVTQVPTSVEVAPAEITLQAVQDTARLSATARDRNGYAIADGSMVWNSSNDALVTVSESGLVTAVAPGDVTITATTGGVAGTASVQVAQVVVSVELTAASETIHAGQTVQLTARALDGRYNVVDGITFVWASSDTAIARVDEAGLVTGVSAGGPVTITATVGGESGSVTLAVTPAPVASVEVTPVSATVQVGDTQQLSATLRDAAGNVLTGRAVAWSSSNEGLATVSTTGLVTGVGAGGPVTVTATSEGQSGTASVIVTPAPPGPNQMTWRFCARPDVPIWFAVQDGTGPWTQVSGVATADGVSFSFSIGERGGVAFKKANIFIYEEAPVTIFYGTFAELAALRDVRCAFAGRKTLSGSMTGLPPGTSIGMSIGAAVYDIEDSTFTLVNVPEGIQDLLAAADLEEDLREYPTRLIMRRGLNLPNNGVIPTLDFSSSEAFAPVLPPLTINNLASDVACLSMWYLMANSSMRWDPAPIGATNGPFLFFDNCFGGASRQYLGLPGGRQQPEDLHMLWVSDGETVGTTHRSRDVFTFFHQATSRSVTLGPSLSTPAVSLVSAAPYLRYRAQLPVQSEYNRVFWAFYRSWDPQRGVEIMATAAYFGGSVSMWDVTIPDLAGAGVDSSWMPNSGDVVEWDIRAVGWSEGSGIVLVSPVAWLFGPPADGAAIRYASEGIRPGAAPSQHRGAIRGGRE